eukprot:CAMPEP_0185805224 /NCGR_PEP_ID=MMETSP1322-20130828/3725_1 /TAXON_ID=265543 /ORGANISM="Minutocellus polymorphus, Strain RCC2270" /LENGTH=205 /DNA_ID=CAMNT_0028501253 /DNA_START=146 /DNA_END=760 /DNA_ORIENTATION=+
MALLNVGTVIGGWLVISTVGSLYLKSTISATSMVGMLLGNPVAMALLFFNYLNIFIALCEIALGRHAELIKKDYLALKEQFKGKEWDGCLAFLLMPLSVGQIFDMKTWSKMWTTYALYDPSYQNTEAFGFFIDVGNGWSTIPPSVLLNYAIIYGPSGSAGDAITPLLVGCVSIASLWQITYGTIIYFLSFIWNRRYQGFRAGEIW